jgi:hypothetical protein
MIPGRGRLSICRGLTARLLRTYPRAARPWPESFIPLLPTDTYFYSLVWVAPIFFRFQWLCLAAAVHACVRLAGRTSDFDLLLEIAGLSALVVGAFLAPLDRACFLAGLRSRVALGFIHLVCAAWGGVLSVVAWRRPLGVRV